MNNLFCIAFRSYEGPTLVAKVIRNQDGTLKLIEYKPNYVRFDQKKLNKDSNEELENCGVIAKYITEISEENYNEAISQFVENTSDIFIQPAEVRNEIVDSVPELQGRRNEKFDFICAGYYEYNITTKKYEYVKGLTREIAHEYVKGLTREIAHELNEDGISCVYINENKKCFSC